MKRKAARHTQSTHALGFALFIGALIILLILAAVAIKIVLLFQHSVFDGKHQFVIEVREPSQTRFVVFSPSDSSIHTLLLSGKLSGNPELVPGIPVDATLQSPVDIASVGMLVNDLILNRGGVHASTTIIDGFNLFVFSHMADSDKAIAAQTSLSTDETDQDALLSKVFTDSAIYKEGESVAVINGTGISGLGTKIGRLLTHIGANVVSVTTADIPRPTSSVSYAGNPSYTSDRIAHILGLPEVHLSSPTVSDITVILGTDTAGKFQQ